MFKNRFRPLAAVLFALAFVIAACGGDGDSTADPVESDDGGSETQVEPPALGDAAGVIDLSGPVNPGAVSDLILALTGQPPADGEVSCLVDNSDGDTQLTEVFNGFGQQGFELSPEGFTALTVNTHECVASETLVTSLTGLSVIDDDGGAFETCITTEINDETNGDLVYTGLSALLVGFQIPEGARQIAFDTVVECVSEDDLVEQIGFNTESAQGFAVSVDRECLAEGLNDDLIAEFWGSFILLEEAEGEGNIAPFIEGCTGSFDSGLADALPDDFEPWAGEGALALVDPLVRNGIYDAPPPTVIEDGVDYGAVLTTTDGEIVIDLFEENAPVTVNNFVALARDGYYDATVFHRVLEGFMAQGGDPTSSGSGGPGYNFEDEESAFTPIDSRGLLAMANAGPDTNGSQFFITFEPADFLTGMHTVFGEVQDGDPVLGEIDLRDPAAPTSRGEQLISVVITEN